MTAFAFKSDKINIFVLADQVEKKGIQVILHVLHVIVYEHV